LAVVLLAELTAILPGHPNRMPPLLGKARVIDDPGFDPPATLDRRQHELAHPGQHRSVRPWCIAHKMQQGLMLRGDLRRCCHCRHRLDTLALDRHQQSQAVIAHRLLSIGMAQRRAEHLDIGRKSRFTPLTRTAVHSGPPIRKKIAAKYHILRSLDTQIHDVEFCDSVRLGGRWVVRIQFSLAYPTLVGLLDVRPRKNSPGAAAIRALEAVVEQNLHECRARWWTYQRNNPLIQAEGPCCLNNAPYGSWIVRSASYDPVARETRLVSTAGQPMILRMT
jgi:hypothetical protein